MAGISDPASMQVASYWQQLISDHLVRACLDRLTSAVVGPRAVLAPRDVLVLACDTPGR